MIAVVFIVLMGLVVGAVSLFGPAASAATARLTSSARGPRCHAPNSVNGGTIRSTMPSRREETSP